MMDALAQLLGFLLAAVIFWRAESVLNLMAPNSRFLIRVAFWLLAIGALGLIGAIYQGYRPPPIALVILAGTALLLMSERRAQTILRTFVPVAHERRKARP